MAMMPATGKADTRRARFLPSSLKTARVQLE
jgi:hypothetical protein